MHAVVDRSRTETRRHLSEVVRIERLEEDADDMEDFRAEMRRQYARIVGLLLAGLVSFATMAVMFAVQAATGR